MAFLKETERSLRIYFIVAGALAALSAYVGLGDATHMAGPKPALVTLAVWFVALGRAVLGPAFIIAGFMLKRSLETGAEGTKKLVKIAAAALVTEVVLYALALSRLGAAQSSAELAGRAFGRALIPLLILWYIHASLRRLSAEAHQRIMDIAVRKFD